MFDALSTNKANRLWRGLIIGVMLLSLIASSLLHAPTKTYAANWQEIGAILGNPLQVCFDGNQPDTLLAAYSYGAVATISYNLKTGQSTILNNRPFNLCDETTGLLFARNDDDTALRFSSRDPQGQTIAHYPSAIASDGTLMLYSIQAVDPTNYNTPYKFYASDDAGTSWQERSTPAGLVIRSVAVAPADSKAIYAAFINRQPTSSTDQVTHSVYFSPNGGQTWEKRYENNEFGDVIYNVRAASGSATPLDALILDKRNGVSPGSLHTTVYVSGNGGRNFYEAGINWLYASRNVNAYHTQSGFVRYSAERIAPANQLIATSGNGGQSWDLQTLPFTAQNNVVGVLQQATHAPDNLFLSKYVANSIEEIWYSSNGGKKFQSLPQDGLKFNALYISPNAPTYVVGRENNGKLYRLDLPQADQTLTGAALPNNASGGAFFDKTSHNISPLFKAYWEQKGGLAQFGYPKTEAFREYNPADGKVYTVQYFERNRFEYHPELKGTPYEVLLGLLGNQLTTGRQNETPFQRAQPIAGARYFGDTGHNLFGSFRDYWEAHGGLAIYGNPISEEFKEVNPDDGQTYTVQYFERNRFEYHPANKGTPYEVELGLLGNTLLKQKGWLN